MLSRATIRQRMGMLAALLALVMLVVAVTGPLAIRERDAAGQERRERIEPLRIGVSELQLATVDARLAVQGYLLGADESYVRKYESASSRARRMMLDLVDASREDTPTRDLRRVSAAFARWERDAAVPIMESVREGRVDEAMAVELGGTGEAAFDDVVAEIRNLRTGLVAHVVAADARVAAARTRLTALVWVLILVGVAFTVLVSVLARRWVTAPLESIARDVDAVRRGDRHRAITPVGPPDLARLAANVEAMRSETVRHLDEAVRAKEALEQQGPAVVTLRNELSPIGTWPDCADIAAVFQPAHGFLAGDWYDVVDKGGGRFVLMVVDVSGHGSGAGVFALRAKHLLLAAVTDGLGPGAALEWLGARIGETGERFLTGFVAEFDVENRRLRYANAGHPPAVLTDSESGFGEPLLLPPTGPLLGPLPGRWSTREVVFPPSARLVVYTDGVVEARDVDGRSFGEEGLRAVLADLWERPADTARACHDAIRRFSGGRLEDDVTVVAVQGRPD